MDAFMGTVLPVAFNYPPQGWMFCNGQTVAIQQNSAMFALLGTMYGGDGQNTFGLPDLRGRVIVGSQAQGPGLANVAQGEKAGSNNTTVIANGTVNITLSLANLPAHNHPATLSLDALTGQTTISVGTGAAAAGTGLTAQAGSLLTSAAAGGGAAAIYLPTGTPQTAPVNLGGVTTTVGGTGSVSTGNTGTGTPLAAPVVTNATVSIMQPYLGLNYIIAMQGIFPSRN
ncbi:MAG: phage tail protein [Candidatus Aquirickettsiella gammari]